MDLTNRQQRIIMLLTQSNSPITGREIAFRINLSYRATQNEMEQLKKLCIVVSGPNGYKLVINEKTKDILSLLSPKMDKDTKGLLRKLLFRSDRRDIDELADELYISTSSLRKRLKELAKQLKKYELDVVISKNEVSIEGKEIQKRKAIRDYIYKEISPNFSSISCCSEYIEDLDIIYLKNIIIDAVHKNGCLIQETYASNLILNVIIALYRIHNGQHISSDEFTVQKDSTEYKIAEQICNECKEKTVIQPNEQDIYYIAQLFYGQIHSGYMARQETSTELSQLEQETYDLLSHVLERYMLAIELSPYISNLARHVHDMLKRAGIGNYVVCDMYKNIRSNTPFVYEVAVLFAREIEKKYRCKLPHDEIGLLAIHIGLIIENVIRDTDVVNVLVCSSSYQGISAKIMNYLNEYYGKRISVRSIEGAFDEDAINYLPDVIISTYPLSSIGKKVVNISPVFSAMDRFLIDTAIQSCADEKSMLKNNAYLYSCFHEELFFRRTDLKRWDEVIVFLGQKMINFGICKPGFIESVMQRESMSSTCFFDTFAIPHSLEMDANQTMIAVLINDEGIFWDQTKIYMCLLFAIRADDRKRFSQAYNNIVRVLCDSDRVRELIKSNSLSEFLNHLKA